MAIAEREVLSVQPNEAPTQERFYTVEEYLTLEKAATERHEYVQGRIRLMSGGTEDHATIPMNLGAELRAALRGRGCRVMTSDIKVYAAGEVYYPDVTVACGPRQYYGSNRTVITNPLLVAEVLSPSTAHVDRGEKFHNYLTVESLAVYLIVSQDRPLVEQYSRGESGRWDYTLVAGLEGELSIPALGIALAMSEIYAEIDFTEEATNE